MKKIVLFLWLSSAFASEKYIEFTSPKGGWRDSSNKKTGFLQKVFYPDSRINNGAESSDTGKIEGIIKGDIKKSDKPYTLVVNGNAMPLIVDGGKFSRPYSFPKGTNSVEILSPERDVTQAVQFYDVTQRDNSARIRVILGWDTDGTDIDLHLITPDGEHCYYGNRVLKNGTALDVDVTTGFGPEIIASPGSVKGPYYVFVNYYGRASNKAITVATVTVILNEGTLDEKVETLRIPLRRTGELTHIYSFNY